MAGVLLILAAALLIHTTSNPIGRGIGFQAHSYNDMRSWHQLFLKGATHIKIDPNYRPPAFCTDQLRIRNRTDPRGCFVLNHDTPTLLGRNYRRDYNSTGDLLALLAERSGPLYPFLTRPSVRVFFALCFKSIPIDVCAQTTAAARHWRSLVDQLVASFLELSSRDPALNVEFVLDSGVPQRCFLQRWRPLVGTSSPFPQQAFTSDNATLGYDRWGVLNANWPAGELQHYASKKWGKFATAPRALQVYEPCDQQDFLDAAAVYIGAGIDHASGLKFAINIDVAMSEVFLSNVTGRGLNEPLFDDVAVLPTGTRIAVVPPASGRDVFSSDCPVEAGPQAAAVLATFADDGQSGGVRYSIRSAARGSPAAPAHPLPGFEDLSGRPPEALSVSGSMVLAWTGERVRILEVEVPGNLLLRHAFTWPTNDNNHTTVATALVTENTAACNATAGLLLIVRVTTNADGEVWFQLWSLATSQQQQTPVAIAPPVPFGPVTAGLVSAGVAAGAQVENDTKTMQNDWTSKRVRVTAVMVYEMQGAALGLATLVDTLSCTSKVCTEISPPGVIKPTSAHTVDAGTAPVLATGVDPLTDRIVVGEVHADAFCANNEKRNKQTRVGSCDLIPKSTPGVLGYTVGTLGSWIKLANEPAPRLSACSSTLLHGTFSQGFAPTTAMSVTYGDRVDDLVVQTLVVHKEYNGTDPSKCGMPVSAISRDRSGVLLDSWSFVLPDRGG